VGELQLQLRSRRRAQALGQAAGGRGLLLPTGFRADRRLWARLRKRAFRDPPRQRNRVWQMDSSEFRPRDADPRPGFERPVRLKDVLFPLGNQQFARGYHVELWIVGFPAFSYQGET
jgi:hypothetical protein